jgi:hypothetical protein
VEQNNTFARHHPHRVSGSLTLGVAGRTAGLSATHCAKTRVARPRLSAWRSATAAMSAGGECGERGVR